MKKTTLKTLREKRGLTQEEVSKITGKSVTYISMLETGRRNPSDATKRKLAKVYNCNIFDIFLALGLTESYKKKGDD